MKKYLIVALIIILGFVTILPACFSKKRNGVAAVKELTETKMHDFRGFIMDSLLPLAERSVNTDSLQNSFLRARLLYKQIEWAAEYFMPATTRMVNGPPLPEIENEENKVVAPDGLQVIEPFLFPSFDTANRAELVRQVRLLQTRAFYYEQFWKNTGIDSAHIFDAMKLALFRSISLGLSGFDTPLAKSGISEAAAVFASVQQLILAFTGNNKDEIPLYAQITKAIAYLDTHPDFDSFDRLHFITRYVNGITSGMITLQRQSGVPFVQDVRLLKPSAATMFDNDAFDINAYTPDSAYYFTGEKALIGKKLFYDPVLSSANTRSCASCHDPAKAFTDGLPASTALNEGFVKRNAPTLLNAALQPAQFYDLRGTNLENQAADVIRNPDEMHGNLESAIVKIRDDSAYSRLFKEAWPNADGWRPSHIQNAIASYIRTLLSLNSRFDRYMRGDESLLNEEEKKGFNLFMGKAKCGTCHFMPLFNGTVPPAFTKIESEVIGVPQAAGKKEIDDDPGRYALYRLEPYKHAFKTTTVRNAALTGPFMHNGVYKSLEEVMDFYSEGGGVGLGFEVPNQTLPFDKLSLSQEEKKAVIAFLNSLTDTSSAKL